MYFYPVVLKVLITSIAINSMSRYKQKQLLFSVLLSILHCNSPGRGLSDPSDAAIMNDFRNGLTNPELLQWPKDNDPCKWRCVLCHGGRVTQIVVGNFGLNGTLPGNLNQLTQLILLDVQRNSFFGKLPSLSGLSELQYAFFSMNYFDTIPSDFFDGLVSLMSLSLDFNPLNISGWTLPSELQSSTELLNLSLISTNLVGPLPEFLGRIPSLTVLHLENNMLVGLIPLEFTSLPLRVLVLDGNMLMGPIPLFGEGVNVSYVGNSFCHSEPGVPCSPEVNALLGFLSDVNYPTTLVNSWLGNSPCFNGWQGINCNTDNDLILTINLPYRSLNGTLSPALGRLDSLKTIILTGNSLTGVIPASYTELQSLEELRLEDNNIEPPVPAFRSNVNLHLEGNNLLYGSPSTPTSSPLPNSGDAPGYPLPPNWGASKSRNSKAEKLMFIVLPALVLFQVLLLSVWCICKKNRHGVRTEPSLRRKHSEVTEATSHQSDQISSVIPGASFETGSLVVSALHGYFSRSRAADQRLPSPNR
ncbi:hypothetical protein H6P81_015751 [Aristolochia fimbriata]|uniref:Leucine-rich repeat-containing N-terminal plant-type domain-containing protein n=1 Tax=Aristolochia fimbriata TaxID=158543 RepID=A0AAV7E7N6_ARIFI|nr:hypothetical protein H6P81_015751 [Aristolochia fimbriata]